MESRASLPAFRIRNGRYVDLDMLISSGLEYKPANSETFLYSVMKLKNGFVFAQNKKYTGKQSYLFLNIETLSLKQLSGKISIKRQRGKPSSQSKQVV